MTNKRISKKTIIEAIKEDYTIFYRPMPEEWKVKFPVITVDVLKELGLHFTTDHNGKMQGMYSFSTTCKCNALCKKRIETALKKANANFTWDSPKEVKKAVKAMLKSMLAENPLRQDISICGFCFSDAQQDYMTSMKTPLSRNFEIINNGIIHEDWIPTLNNLYFRFESFGDFASINAVINCYNFCRKNPFVKFAAWTKNPIFFRRVNAIYGSCKPENLTLILSSQFINKKAIVKDSEKFVLFDRVFTVYTPEYATANGIFINCGARACLACLRCYTKKNGVVQFEISELLK